ncbi:MAG: hypothetical protein WAV25_01790 [Minisyncoccia bacterium]
MTTDSRTFAQIVGGILDLISLVVPVLAGAAMLVFFWGLVKFIWKSGDEASHEDGKNLMKWGIIALFIMVSYISIVQFLYVGFGFGTGSSFGIPLLPTNHS